MLFANAVNPDCDSVARKYLANQATNRGILKSKVYKMAEKRKKSPTKRFI